MTQLIRRMFVRISVAGSDRGATAVEYALIAFLIAVTVIGGLTLFGQSVAHLFEDSANKMP
jgi:Flp pilus assembly pilin Flp